MAHLSEDWGGLTQKEKKEIEGAENPEETNDDYEFQVTINGGRRKGKKGIREKKTRGLVIETDASFGNRGRQRIRPGKRRARGGGPGRHRERGEKGRFSNQKAKPRGRSEGEREGNYLKTFHEGGRILKRWA